MGKKKQTTKSMANTNPKIADFKLGDLKHAKYNPRRISDSALEGLSNSLKRFGCVEPKKPENITELAHKQRHVALLQKVKEGSKLSKAEIRELERYERNSVKTLREKLKSGFTIKQQCFIDCYDGDLKKAAKKAGISYIYARSLYTKTDILEAIKHREDTEVRPSTIMTRQQRQQFWSKVADDDNQEMRDRLRASELLGKSEADFTENLSHHFPEGCGVMIVQGEMNPEDWPKKSKQYHDEICNGNGNGNGNKKKA